MLSHVTLSLVPVIVPALPPTKAVIKRTKESFAGRKFMTRTSEPLLIQLAILPPINAATPSHSHTRRRFVITSIMAKKVAL